MARPSDTSLSSGKQSSARALQRPKTAPTLSSSNIVTTQSHQDSSSDSSIAAANPSHSASTSASAQRPGNSLPQSVPLLDSVSIASTSALSEFPPSEHRPSSGVAPNVLTPDQGELCFEEIQHKAFNLSVENVSPVSWKIRVTSKIPQVLLNAQPRYYCCVSHTHVKKARSAFL
jgi:hypothetical protein